MRKDAGCSNALDYVEQSSWILFLKYLNDYENENRDAAELMNKEYVEIIPEKIKWRNWAAPKKANGDRDVIMSLAGDD